MGHRLIATEHDAGTAAHTEHRAAAGCPGASDFLTADGERTSRSRVQGCLLPSANIIIRHGNMLCSTVAWPAASATEHSTAKPRPRRTTRSLSYKKPNQIRDDGRAAAVPPLLLPAPPAEAKSLSLVMASSAMKLMKRATISVHDQRGL